MAQKMDVCVGTDNGGKKYGAFHIRVALSKGLKCVKSLKRLYLSDPYFYSLVLTCKIYQLFGKLEALTHYISREIPGNQSLPDFS